MRLFKNYNVAIEFKSGLGTVINNVVSVQETECMFEIFYYVVGDELGKLLLCKQEVAQVRRVSI